MSTDHRPESRAEATSVTIDVCYPDGRMKTAEWGTSWLAETAALILSDSVMDPEQKDRFRGKRKGLRKLTWKDRPTMIRKMSDGQNEPVCSVGEFPNSRSPNEGLAECDSASDVRGVLLKMTFRVLHKGRNCTIVLKRESLADTAILVFDPDRMTSSERSQFSQKVNAVAIRRLVTPQEDPILVCCDTIAEGAATNSSKKYLTAACGIGSSSISTWK